MCKMASTDKMGEHRSTHIIPKVGKKGLQIKHNFENGQYKQFLKLVVTGQLY